MTDTTPRPGTEWHRSADETTAQHGPKHSLHAPDSRGRTTIADTVAEKIAGMATREVPGIHNLGSGMARTIGGVRERMPGGQPSITRGVHVEVGEHQTAVDLDVVVDYGFPIVDVAADVRTNVIEAVERMTGLEVVEVNVAVDDIHLPEDEGEGEGEGHRVE
ncbi:Asp23/Gls24 family envelope stress response protein [Streptomyces sp. MK37H]|uniref:Asp23/Gls24 family envelope stress response protein n=1 Tax=Streptomyces sp. MK37H TaxID=2699117 RepID=UPI001B359C0A|nr:Asp23/Gls24 family envelope stress response protein [Streptomyces sp. MK37H]MBP8535108.1 Asp23/Gls24 family envelope stress response protein [Streptomyces sp. MK37H]